MVNKYINKSSTYLAIKEIEIKITLRFTTVKMAIIKKMNNTKCCGGLGVGEQRNSCIL
jgi:hypothetical protein